MLDKSAFAPSLTNFTSRLDFNTLMKRSNSNGNCYVSCSCGCLDGTQHDIAPTERIGRQRSRALAALSVQDSSALLAPLLHDILPWRQQLEVVRPTPMQVRFKQPRGSQNNNGNAPTQVGTRSLSMDLQGPRSKVQFIL